MNFLFNPEYSTLWAALSTASDGIASILAIVALIYSMTTFRKSLQTSHYGELDTMYFEIQKATLDKPHLINPNADRTDEQKLEYNIYAFMVWNFIESIYDRCEHSDQLRNTWYPIIDAEDRMHRHWFDHPDNRHKFKSEFFNFIQNESYRDKFRTSEK